MVTIALTCTSCGKQYQLPDKLAGKKAKCKCGHTMLVPEQSPDPEPLSDVVDLMPVEEQDDLGSLLDDALPMAGSSLPTAPVPSMPSSLPQAGLPSGGIPAGGMPMADQQPAAPAKRRKKLPAGLMMALITVGGLLGIGVLLLIVVVVGNRVMRPGYGSPGEVVAAYQLALERQDRSKLYATLDPQSLQTVASKLTVLAVSSLGKTALIQEFFQSRGAGDLLAAEPDELQQQADQLAKGLEKPAKFCAELLAAIDQAEEGEMPRNPLMKTMIKKPRGVARRTLASAPLSSLETAENSAHGTLTFPWKDEKLEANILFTKFDGRWFVQYKEPESLDDRPVAASFDGFRSFP